MEKKLRMCFFLLNTIDGQNLLDWNVFLPFNVNF